MSTNLFVFNRCGQTEPKNLNGHQHINNSIRNYVIFLTSGLDETMSVDVHAPFFYGPSDSYSSARRLSCTGTCMYPMPHSSPANPNPTTVTNPNSKPSYNPNPKLLKKILRQDKRY